MNSANYIKAGIFTLLIVLTVIICWELRLRNRGLNVDYDDGHELWSDKRAMVYQPVNEATVFIGSSRNKFDIDVDTWRKNTGDKAVQLAIEGNSPLPVLSDLANDVNFKGKLIVDVTEGLFFSTSPNNTESPHKHIEYYKKRTPAQRFSFQVNHVLESQLVFLDKYNFSLNALLSRLPIEKREGVFAMPFEFPLEVGRVTFDRQNIMMQEFVDSKILRNRVKSIWVFFDAINEELPAAGKKLDSILNAVKLDCDKIKARGGQIVFVRSPSSGPYLVGEKKAFPREKYWDRLLAVTGVEGIYFEDYHAIAHFNCPEWSHLPHGDAIIFTKNIIKILEEEKGFTFQN